MPEEIIIDDSKKGVQDTPSPGAEDIKETQAYKDAITANREEMRTNFEAEHNRKLEIAKQDLEAQYKQSAVPAGQTEDWFEQFEARHGISAAAARELMQGAVAVVERDYISPLSKSAGKQEIRSQRIELRNADPDLAELDTRFHKEVMQQIEKLKPDQIFADTYATYLDLIVGQNYKTLKAEGAAGAGASDDDAAAAKEPEVIDGKPGPTPQGSGSQSKTKIKLNRAQTQWCSDRKMSEEAFVAFMKKRVQLRKAAGVSDAVIRQQFGDLLGSISL